MTAVLSTSISTHRSVKKCPIIKHRLLSLDAGQHRRQLEHLEYYWGLRKGELDLESQLNHVELRSDMSEKLTSGAWTLIPTAEVSEAMLKMAEYNATAPLHARKHYLAEFPARVYEYDVIPLCMLEGKSPALYVHGGARAKMHRAPYKNLPRIKSHAHPFFATWASSEQLLMNAPLVMPIDEARSLMQRVSKIINCWYNQPPEAFLDGPDVWRNHRHPLSDDGQEADTALRSSRKGNVSPSAVRKTTRAPCRQAKVVARATPYARYDSRHAAERGSALPRPGIQSEERPEGYIAYDISDLHAWVDCIAAESSPVSRSWSEAWLDEESAADSMLAEYRRENVRDVKEAVYGGVVVGSGLIFGQGEDRSRYSSNAWALRAYDVRLRHPTVKI
ncbi:hypothetical protein FB107DRAFT_279020 [Schizophyllum commune]